MATWSHAESRRLYSWWWDSHISPKNSKWLQENLTDMDVNVKSMIKLIEEDADSFARRAEMYYKKRPELMKLVEEFYRAYRALAERYDHATGALRQAHRTMAEAFPNQVPFALTDDSPSGSSTTDGEPRTPEMPPPVRAFIEPDDLQKDALGQSSHFHAIKRNGAYSDENDALNSKRGLKQLNEMFASGEASGQLKFAEGKVRKGLNFHEEEGKIPERTMHNGSIDIQMNEKGGKDDAHEKTRILQDEVSQLFSENQTLKMQIKSEHDRVAKCENEILRLQESLSKLEAEKEVALLQCQKSLEKISTLEMEISHAHEDNGKLNSEMVIKLAKLKGAEGQCLRLETEKQALDIEVKAMAHQKTAQQQELQQKQEEIDRLKYDAYERTRVLQDEVSQLLSENQTLKVQIKSDHDHVAKCENEIQRLQESLSRSEADKEVALLQCQKSLEKISNLEMEISHTHEDSRKLHSEMVIEHTRLESAEGQCLLLETEKQALETEVKNLAHQKNAQQQELQRKQDEIAKLKDDAYERTRILQDEVSQLLSKNEALKMQIKSEHDSAVRSENENLRLQESLSRSDADKETAFLQCQKSLEKISNLEAEISCIHEDSRKLSNEMVIHLAKLESSEGRCLLLETEKQDLGAEINALSQQKNAQQQELQWKQDEVDELKHSLQEEHDRYTQAEAALHSLEKLHSQSLGKLSMIELELKSGIEKLKDMEIRKRSLEEDIWQVKEDNNILNKELQLKEEELKKLNISIQGERLSSMQAEAALQSMEKLHSQSQEEIKLLMLDVQSKVEMLKDMEFQKHHLEKEVQQLEEKNGNLNEQVLSSASIIKNLQEEILNLKETQLNHEKDVEHHLLGNKALHQTIHLLQGEVADLNLKQQCVMEQIEEVGLNKESFQASVRELQDGNLKLKDICRRHEDEKAILTNKLENMEKVTEKNTLLEASLSNATVELEGLREKVNSLEESCESLNKRTFDLITENSSLVYQLEFVTQKIERLSDNKTFLENSLSDANVELEGLRGKLKSLEESSQSLYDENSNLQSEKMTLVSQLENLGATLGNMKRSYAELEDRHLHLEQEKESTLNLVSELQNLLKLEQHEHEAFVLSSNTQLATLGDQMSVLQEESQSKDQKFEGIQYKLLNCEIQAFILQRCLLDSKEWNKKLLASSTCIEKLLSDMKHENIEQKKMIECISEHNKNLQKGIQMIFTSPGINHTCVSGGTEDELHCQNILGEIKEIQNLISDTVDENHAWLIEKSVITTLMQQLGLDLKILNSEKSAINLEYRIGTQELLALKNDKHDLLHINEELRQSIHAGRLREDRLKTEMDGLDKQLLELQGRHKESQAEICILLEENHSLSNEVSSLRDETENLEEEISAIFAEAINLSSLSLILGQFGAERAMDLRICSSDLDSLHRVNKILEKKVAEMAQKIELIEAENMVLKDSAVKLEECQGQLLMLQDDLNMARNVHEQLNHQIGQLSYQIDSGEGLLIQKDMELVEANKKMDSTEHENMSLRRDLEVIKAELYEVMGVRKELEEKICMLVDGNLHKDGEIAVTREANQMLSAIIQNLRKELVELSASKEQLASELAYEIELYEEEVVRLWNYSHVSSVRVEIFEEKMLELIGECESLEISAIVQRNILKEQIILNNTCAYQLNQKLDYLERESRTLKDKLNAYLPLVLSLQNGIASLENQILSLTKRQELDGHSVQDASLAKLEHVEGCPQLLADVSTIEPDGILGLHKLQARVEELQKVLMDCNLMMRESDVKAKSAAMKMEVEISKHERTLGEEEAQVNKNNITQPEVDVREPKDVLQACGAENSKGSYGLMMKDIQLDQSSNDIGSGLYNKGRAENAETDDQMLKLWETAESDCNNEMLRASCITTADDIDYHQIEPVEEEKSEYPCEPVAEKELGVDKLRISKRAGSHQEWNKRILDRLASDAQRLTILQNSVQELKKQLEKSEKSDTSTNMKYDTMKGQLKRAEEAISGLVDINANLTKKAEDCSVSFDSKFGEQEESRKQQRRQVSDHVQSGSDKIVRLELELQKIQYILLKLDEERENRTRAAQGRSRVVLRDYLYGRRENFRRKRGHFCGCIRPKTSDD